MDGFNIMQGFLKLDFYALVKDMADRFLTMFDRASSIKHVIPVLFIFNGLGPDVHKPIATYH